MKQQSEHLDEKMHELKDGLMKLRQERDNRGQEPGNGFSDFFRRLNLFC